MREVLAAQAERARSQGLTMLYRVSRQQASGDGADWAIDGFLGVVSRQAVWLWFAVGVLAVGGGPGRRSVLGLS